MPPARTRRPRGSHAKPAHVPTPTLDLRPHHQVLRAILVPGARGHGVLVQQARAPLQLRAVDLGHEL
eukprot:15456535-Alexandrium_andersonii.AAC.1